MGTKRSGGSLTRRSTWGGPSSGFRVRGKDGMEVLRAARGNPPPPSVVVMTGYGSVESAVAAMKSGAEDYLTKPFPVEALLLLLGKIVRVRSLEEENRDLKRRIQDRSLYEDLVGGSKAMQGIFDLVSMVAGAEAPVLILGERGT